MTPQLYVRALHDQPKVLKPVLLERLLLLFRTPRPIRLRVSPALALQLSNDVRCQFVHGLQQGHAFLAPCDRRARRLRVPAVLRLDVVAPFGRLVHEVVVVFQVAFVAGAAVAGGVFEVEEDASESMGLGLEGI